MSDALERHVLVVRRGPGANCSSIGSAVEMLFLSATVGTALLAAATALLRQDVDAREEKREEAREEAREEEREEKREEAP